jgi:hypothetical protein
MKDEGLEAMSGRFSAHLVSEGIHSFSRRLLPAHAKTSATFTANPGSTSPPVNVSVSFNKVISPWL